MKRQYIVFIVIRIHGCEASRVLKSWYLRFNLCTMMGDPAIGNGTDANQAEVIANETLHYQSFCPVCGYSPTEYTHVEIYRTPVGLHIQLCFMHPGTRGEPHGCYWSLPLTVQASIPHVGPLAYNDQQPPSSDASDWVAGRSERILACKLRMLL